MPSSTFVPPDASAIVFFTWQSLCCPGIISCKKRSCMLNTIEAWHAFRKSAKACRTSTSWAGVDTRHGKTRELDRARWWVRLHRHSGQTGGSVYPNADEPGTMINSRYRQINKALSDLYHYAYNPRGIQRCNPLCNKVSNNMTLHTS